MLNSVSSDIEVWRDRLHEKELQLERAESRHNAQTVRFVDEITKLREEKFRFEEVIVAKENKLQEATTIISDLRRHMIQQEVTRDAIEAKEEIRRRAKCDRTVQCDLGVTTLPQLSLANPRESLSPLARTRPGSAFLNLALQERERCAKSTLTTALTQTDPVIVMDLPSEHEELSPTIPALAIGKRSMSPCAPFTGRTPILTSHPSSAISTARETEPLTARDLQYFPVNGYTPRSAMLTSRQLTSQVALSDTLRLSDASPEVMGEDGTEVTHHYASISRTPRALLQLPNGLHLQEDPRIDTMEELEADQAIAAPTGITLRSTSQQTNEPRYVSTACNTDTLQSETPIANRIEMAVHSKAASHTEVVVDRVGALLTAIKGELDQDGHFAALFVTGMLASIMFAR